MVRQSELDPSTCGGAGVKTVWPYIVNTGRLESVKVDMRAMPIDDLLVAVHLFTRFKV